MFKTERDFEMQETNNKKAKKAQSFMINVSIVLFAQFAVKILGLVYRVVLTNIDGFGDAGNGFYTAGFQVYTVLLAISSVGIPNAIAKMVSERAALNDYKGAHNIFKSAFLLFACIGAFCALLLYIGADFVSTYIIGNSEIRYVMRALAPSIFFVCVSSVIRGYFQGLNDMNATSRSQILEQIFKCGLTILFVVLTVGVMPLIMELFSHGFLLADKLYYTEAVNGQEVTKTLPEIMAAWANLASSAATLISFAYLILFYARRKKGLREKIRQSAVDSLKESTGHIMKSVLMLSVPISLASIVTAVNRVIDTATITRGIEIAFANGIPAYEGNAAIPHPTLKELSDYAIILAGRLSKSDTIINMPLALNVAFSTVLVPSIAGALAKGDKKEASDKISYSFLISILLILPCVIGLIVLANPIYKLLYPAASLGSDLLALMAVSLIFSALFQTMSGALQGMGKVFSPAVGLLVGCAIKIILNVVLIRQRAINIYGAAISSIICQFAAFVICYAILSKHLTVGITFKKYILKPLSAGLIMGAGAYLAYHALYALIGSNLISVLSALIAAVIIYAVMTFSLRVLDEEEIKMLPGGGRLYSLLVKLKLYPSDNK